MVKLKTFLQKPFFRHPITVILIGTIMLWLISLSLPIILAYLTALLLEPLILKIGKRLHFKRSIVVSIFFIILFILSTLICLLIGYIAWKQFSAFLNHFPEYINQLSAFWIQIQSKLAVYTHPLPLELVIQIQTLISRGLISLEDFAFSLTNLNYWSSFMTHLPTLLFDVLIYWLVLYMLLLELPSINKKLLSPVPFHHQQKLILIAQRVKIALFGFIKAQVLVAICIFIVALLAFFLLKIPFPIVLALLLVILDGIPFLDSIILLGPWSIYKVVTGEYLFALALIILTVVLFLIRRIIEPKIIGDQIGLSSLSTLISMFIGFKIFGFLGILIGPLVIVVIITLINPPPSKNLPPTEE